MNARYIAGYVHEGMMESYRVRPNEERANLLELMAWLSHFELETSPLLSSQKEPQDPLLSVLSNSISRGAPTRSSLFVERVLSRAFGFEEVSDGTGAIHFSRRTSASLLQAFHDAFHIVDPRLSAHTLLEYYNPTWERLDSACERDFLTQSLPALAGSDAIVQLMELQRPFESIVDRRGDFTAQRADFTCEFPYPISGKHGFIIEVDGPHHDNVDQRLLDTRRDHAATECGWQTLRLPVAEWHQLPRRMQPFLNTLQTPAFATIMRNYAQPLYAHEEGLDALQLALAPLAIARVQKTVVELLLSGALRLDAHEWRIVAFEQDVPCASLAIRDLMVQLRKLKRLAGDDARLPRVSIDVYCTREFLHARLGRWDGARRRLIEEHPKGIACDLLLDISMLQRSGFRHVESFVDFTHYAAIRSSHNRSEPRRFRTTNVITYQPLAELSPEGSWQPLPDRVPLITYFLGNLFRKKAFRPGQVEILNRALQGKTVIGLLPTGGGKSITYQLATILQPGVSLVVDPIKSLMKDQYDGLRRNYIDACVYVNSSVSVEKKRKFLKQFREGQALFCFVSPERLQIEEFRNELKAMEEEGVYFAYCVIDEVHCVSEWGHDFRTSYLHLGANAMAFCRTRNLPTVPLFGLTATASYDVLSDVQRELSGTAPDERLEEDAIVHIASVHRPELNYAVIPVLPGDGVAAGNDYQAKMAVGTSKRDALNQLLHRMHMKLHSINAQYGNKGLVHHVIPDYDPAKFITPDHAHAGIIFCPHRTWVFGVTDMFRNPPPRQGLAGIYDNLAVHWEKGFFMGSSERDGASSPLVEAESMRNQDRFLNNELDVMVATKAFGMGIDKPNVRYTVHINYPQSIESFVQEAGRAGRDGRAALCNILFCEGVQQFDVDRDNMIYFHQNSFKGEEKEKRILFELLRSIEYPAFKIVDSLAQWILREYEIDSSIYVAGQAQSERLVLRDRWGPTLGYVQLDQSLSIHPDAQYPDQDLCKSALASLSGEVRARSSSVTNVATWLRGTDTIPDAPGIEAILQSLAGSGEAEQIIGFTNDPVRTRHRIAQAVRTACNVTLGEDVIKQIKIGSWDDVVKSLKDHVRLQGIGNGTDVVRSAWYRSRSKEDTEKALYRLTVLGVLDDIAVDWNKMVYRVRIVKKTDAQYRQALYNYIRQYYSETRTQGFLAEADAHRGESTLQKYLGFLVEFIYKEVAGKRYQGILAMREACVEGTKPNGPEAFAEFIDLYFNSRYARREYLPIDTDNGRIFPLAVVWKYTKMVDEDPAGPVVNNLKNLRGAAVRLLVQNPDNPVFLLLKAYAQLILEPGNEAMRDDSLRNLTKGVQILLRDGQEPMEERISVVARFIDEIRQHSSDERIIQPLQSLEKYPSLVQHLSWLKSFNSHFLDAYEHRHS